jgi:hypothetical protein
MPENIAAILPESWIAILKAFLARRIDAGAALLITPEATQLLRSPGDAGDSILNGSFALASSRERAGFM